MTARLSARRGALTFAAIALLVTACTGGPAAGSGRRGGSAGTSRAGDRAGTQAASGPAAPAAAAATPAPARAGRAPGQQLITVTAPFPGSTYAQLTAYRWTGGRWQRVLGPWTARIGRDGMAPPGRKREGDGRTPSGSFRISYLFGTGPDPGFAFGYRRSHWYDVWDDDPASPWYNEWVDVRRHDPGASPEPMDVSAYVYGAAIAYNTARTPGLGSAIFLHASIGTATAGCITLPVPRLLRVLRWLDPARSPSIRLAVRS